MPDIHDFFNRAFARMTSRRLEQIPTKPVTFERVTRHEHFATGLVDIRAGQPFNDTLNDPVWAYERGRKLGGIVPLSMPLFIRRGLNPKAVAAFRTAVWRGWILR
jgi:hypothetical protein